MELEMTVALSSQAPGAIRESLERRYTATMAPSLLDDIKIMASELVTNAVVHSGCPKGDPLSVSSTVANGIVHVEVVDQGLGIALLEPRSLMPPSVLGYLEILSDRWSSHQGNSFHVWFEIDVTSQTLVTRARPIEREDGNETWP